MALAGLLDEAITALDDAAVTFAKDSPSLNELDAMWTMVGTVGTDSYGSALMIAPVASVPPAPPIPVKTTGMKITGILNTPAVSLGSSFYSGPISPDFTADYLAAARMYAEPPPRRSSPVQLAGMARAAADLIEERGWCQGRLRDLAGQHCAMGALQAAGASNWDLEEFNGHAIRFLADRGDRRRAYWADISGPWNSVVSWNDAPDRTAAQVTGMLRAVASALEAQALPSWDPMVRRAPAMAF